MRKNHKRPHLELPHEEGDGIRVLRVPKSDPQNVLASTSKCIPLADSRPLTPKQTLAKIRLLISVEILKATELHKAKYTAEEIAAYARKKVVMKEIEDLNRKIDSAKQSLRVIKKVFKKESGFQPVKPRNWEQKALEEMEKKKWGVVSISRFKTWQALKSYTLSLNEAQAIAEEKGWWHREEVKGQTARCVPIFISPFAVRNALARKVGISPGMVDARLRELEKKGAIEKKGKLGQNEPMIYMMGYFQPIHGKKIWTVKAKNWWAYFKKSRV